MGINGRVVVVQISNLARIKRIKLVLMILVVLIVALIVVILIRQTSHNKSVTTHQMTQSAFGNAPASVTEQAANDIQNHNYAEAEKVLNSYPLSSENENYYVLLADTQVAQAKYNAAISTLKQAQANFGSGYNLDTQFAQLYSQQQDSKDAITYYQMAISSLKLKPNQATDPTAAIASINQIIASLKAGT